MAGKQKTGSVCTVSLKCNASGSQDKFQVKPPGRTVAHFFVSLVIAWSQKRPTKENKYQTAPLVVSQLCNQRSPYEVLADSKSSISAKTLHADKAACLNGKYQSGKSAQVTNAVDL